jgi:hypothetical protein
MPFVVLWSDTARGSYYREVRASGIFDAISVPDELRRVVDFSAADESRSLIGSRNQEPSPIRNSHDFAPSWLRRVSADTSSSKRFYTC